MSALAPLLVGSLILSRFDLWPALLARRRARSAAPEPPRLGWAFLGAAVAAKLWPLVIVPPARSSGRRAAAARAAPLAGVAVASRVAFVPFA